MLSILICSLEARQRQLRELLNTLEPQAVSQPVDILVETDDGQVSIGAKRNSLLDTASRKYLCYIDDDDMVDGSYISRILSRIKSYETLNSGDSPDCVGICGYIRGGSKHGWQFRHSITVTNWCKDKSAMIYFRTPNHLNPIKSEYAKQCRFPESSWGEDRAYSDQVRPFLKTEVFIGHPLYYYQMGNK